MLFLYFLFIKEPETGFQKRLKNKNNKILSSTTISNIDNKLTMISEVTCDTEDWSNDSENSALHDRK